jgi:hypothetical protein
MTLLRLAIPRPIIWDASTVTSRKQLPGMILALGAHSAVRPAIQIQAAPFVDPGISNTQMSQACARPARQIAGSVITRPEKNVCGTIALMVSTP